MLDEITFHGCILDQYTRDETTEQSVIKRYHLLCAHRQRLLEQREHLNRMLAAADQKIERYERHFAHAHKHRQQQAEREREGA